MKKIIEIQQKYDEILYGLHTFSEVIETKNIDKYCIERNWRQKKADTKVDGNKTKERIRFNPPKPSAN